MSLTITTDVFCDYPGCQAWEHGAVDRGVRAKDARTNVFRRGWRNRWFPDPFSGIKVARDLCPDHANVKEWPNA